MASPTSSCFITEAIVGQFHNPKQSDLVFRVEGKSIHVHRQYLSMVSKHLAVMLSEPWTSDGQHEVIITDFDYETFYTYLKFLYSGEVSVTSDNIESLYSLSHRYLESALHQRCERFIKSRLEKESNYDLVCKFGSSDIKHTYIEWANSCKSRDYDLNYRLVVRIATDYELHELRHRIEKFIIDQWVKVSEKTKCGIKSERMFRNIYELGVKYRLEKLQEALIDFLVFHYQEQSCCPCGIRISHEMLLWYYDFALRSGSSRLCAKLLQLFKMKLLANRSDEIVKKFWQLIEQQISNLETLIPLDTLIDLCHHAFEWGNLTENVSFKHNLEIILINHPNLKKEENMFGPTGKFAILTRIADQCDMQKLDCFLTRQFITHLSSLLDGVETKQARKLVQSVLETL